MLCKIFIVSERAQQFSAPRQQPMSLFFAFCGLFRNPASKTFLNGKLAFSLCWRWIYLKLLVLDVFSRLIRCGSIDDREVAACLSISFVRVTNDGFRRFFFCIPTTRIVGPRSKTRNCIFVDFWVGGAMVEFREDVAKVDRSPGTKPSQTFG